MRKVDKQLVAGLAMDLTVNDPFDNAPWDFAIPENRDRARLKLREQKPYLLIGSPCCTQFCTWQKPNALNNTSPDYVMRREKAQRLRLCTWKLLRHYTANKLKTVATFLMHARIRTTMGTWAHD